MTLTCNIRAVFCLVFLALLSSGAQSQTKAEKKFPGMVLEEGQTMADLGRGERVSQPNPKALAALVSDELVSVEVADWIVLTPTSRAPNVGMVFYHGAETDPRVYGRPLRAIAEQGYLVIAVTMPRYLAVMAPNKADEVFAAFPEIEDWVISGHSMGGAMAAQYTLAHPHKISGLLLWDAYPAGNVDLSQIDTLVAQIYRTDLEGNSPDNFRDADHLLPPNALRIPIAGAEHTYFGDYILASHRPTPNASITVDEQQALIVKGSVKFLGIVGQ